MRNLIWAIESKLHSIFCTCFPKSRLRVWILFPPTHIYSYNLILRFSLFYVEHSRIWNISLKGHANHLVQDPPIYMVVSTRQKNAQCHHLWDWAYKNIHILIVDWLCSPLSCTLITYSKRTNNVQSLFLSPAVILCIIIRCGKMQFIITIINIIIDIILLCIIICIIIFALPQY